jgi:2-iminobutanoate/2-iminopropanoate deaminase
MHLTKLALGILAFCLLATNCFAANLTHHNSALQESLGFPFSEAVQVGDTLYLSGQAGNFPGSSDSSTANIGRRPILLAARWPHQCWP